MNPHIVKGYTLGAIAAISYGLNPLFALPLYEGGMGPDSVLFFRYLLAIPVMALMLLIRRGASEFRINTREGVTLAVAGIMVSLSSLTLFQSYNYMDVGIASTLLFVYPIMVALIMTLCFKERFTAVTGLSIALALAGIWFVGKTADGTVISPTGSFLVFVSSLTYALYIVGVNKTMLCRMPTLKVILYVLIFGILLFGIRLMYSGEIEIPDSPWLWLNVLGLAVLPTAVSFASTTAAIQYIGATPTAILGALEPLTAVVVGAMVFGEQLTPRICLGIVLILAGVTMIVSAGNIEQHLLSVRKLFPRLRKK